MKSSPHSRRGSLWCRKRFRGLRDILQVRRAIGTKLVGLGDFALALRARGMQVELAVGAEVEAAADRRAALGAVVGQRLAHQEIDHEADD